MATRHLRCVSDDSGVDVSANNVAEYHDIYSCNLDNCNCPYCVNQFTYCMKCGCVDDELLEYCPGIFLHHDSATEIASGKVRDIRRRK